MEELSNSTKRKKRRTRRCLDEIRNRLRRRKISSDSLERNTTNSKPSTMEPKSFENRFITMDRLTLKAMFPHSIRSETITRPILEEIKQKQNINLNDVIKGGIDKVNQPVVQISPRNNLSANIFSHINTSLTEFEDNFQSREDSNNIHEALSTSSFLLCSSPSITKSRTEIKTANETDTVSSSSTSSEVFQNYQLQRYEDFMNEIPSYFRQLASSVDREDVIKKTITKLQKIYMETCQMSNYDNTRYSNGHVSITEALNIEKETIVENPLDYIRLKHERQQCGKVHHADVALSESSSSSEGASALSATATPILRTSHPDFDIGIVPVDTPVYNYYPHHLKSKQFPLALIYYDLT